VSLKPEAIEKLCDLARLKVGADELDDVVSKLSRIVGFVDQLQSVDTSAVEPMAHPLSQPQRLRADVVTEADQHERFQANAQHVMDGLYLVIKVIE